MCDAYSNYSNEKHHLLLTYYWYTSLLALCLLLFSLCGLCIIHKRFIITDTDKLFTLQLLIFGIINSIGCLHISLKTDEEKATFIPMRVVGTWGCLLSSTILSYNLLIASNRNRFERFNRNKHFYSIIIWFISIVVAMTVSCLYIFHAKPHCLVSFLEFIVCAIAIIYCAITMRYWYKQYQCKINIILLNVSKYLVVIIICFSRYLLSN